LQSVFSFAVRTPGRYIQKHFSEAIHDGAHKLLATVHFAVSLCYTSSGQGEAPAAAPMVLPAESSAEEDASQRSAVRPKKSKATYVRQVTPEIPQQRNRSIFYFDRGDLMEENEALATEVANLRRQVERLKGVVGEARDPRRTSDRQLAGNRTDYIYHPPGLMHTRGARPPPRSART
jgi:hypothetical protein